MGRRDNRRPMAASRITREHAQDRHMRIAFGIVAGITLSILAHTLGWRWLAWTMCRIEVLTPIDWTPKTRVWIKGELQDA